MLKYKYKVKGGNTLAYINKGGIDMISGFRIFLGGCSLYLACGISYLLYVGWRVNNATIGELIKLIKNPPMHMTVFNILLRPFILIKLKFYEIIDKYEEEE